MNGQPTVKNVGERQWQLQKDYAVTFMLRDVLHRLVIKAGMVYDGASIPRWAWTILGKSPMGQHDSGTIFHDLIYMLLKNSKNNAVVGHSVDKCTHTLFIELNGEWHSYMAEMSRKECDAIMFEIIRNTEGVKISKWVLAAMYRGVRIGGAKYWNKSTGNHNINPGNCG